VDPLRPDPVDPVPDPVEPVEPVFDPVLEPVDPVLEPVEPVKLFEPVFEPVPACRPSEQYSAPFQYNDSATAQYKNSVLVSLCTLRSPSPDVSVSDTSHGFLVQEIGRPQTTPLCVVALLRLAHADLRRTPQCGPDLVTPELRVVALTQL
jgi:hypothetical protein